MVGFFCVLIFMMFTSGMSYFYLKKVDSSYSNIVNHQAVKLKIAKEIQINASQEINGLRAYLLFDEESYKDLPEAINNINNSIKALSELVTTPEQTEDLKKLDELNQNFKKLADQTLSLIEKNPNQALLVGSADAIPLAKKIRTRADDFAKSLEKLMVDESQKNKTMVHSTLTTSLLLNAITLILSIFIALIISRKISIGLNLMAKAAGEIASGDLTIEDIELNNKDEIGDLAHSFNKMKRNLSNLISRVDASCEEVNASSQELTASVEETKQVTNQITKAMQEVASGSKLQLHRAEKVYM